MYAYLVEKIDKEQRQVNGLIYIIISDKYKCYEEEIK